MAGGFNLIKRVIKRDGRIKKFDSTKIFNAIVKAMNKVGDVDEKRANNMVNKVCESLEGLSEISVEDIQDRVEHVIIQTKDTVLVKEYIMYRIKRAEVREVLSAHSAWEFELRQEGFTPDDFDFEETVDAVMKEVDHKKHP